MTLEVGGEAWYQSRSRWYVPELGRFLTSDPNATGVPTQQTLAMLGRMPAGPPSGSFGRSSHYKDGWDTFTAYSGNPVGFSDPSGLFAFISDTMGSAVRAGKRAYSAHESAEPAMDLARAITAGASVNQAILAFAADMAFDKIGGDAFDKLVSGIKKAGKKFGKKMPRAFSDAADTWVYAGYNNDDEIVYVGISGDVDRRSVEHKGRGFGVRPIAGPFPRVAARAIEQALILRYKMEKYGGQLENKRNEISESHEWYDDAMEWAEAVIETLGLP